MIQRLAKYAKTEAVSRVVREDFVKFAKMVNVRLPAVAQEIYAEYVIRVPVSLLLLIQKIVRLAHQTREFIVYVILKTEKLVAKELAAINVQDVIVKMFSFRNVSPKPGHLAVKLAIQKQEKSHPAMSQNVKNVSGHTQVLVLDNMFAKTGVVNGPA